MAVYNPLNSARHEIRLLEAVSRSADDFHEQLTCRLSIYSLDDNPSFTALSYVWGDPRDTRPIVVNDTNMEVTANLMDALLQQRDSRMRLIWADALCINQQNSEEKTQQIQMMGTIYSQAADVVAWIGTADTTTERTLATIATIATLGQISNPELFEYPNLSRWSRKHLISYGDNLVTALQEDSTLMPGDIGSVLAFFQRPYWHRLWTIQEVLLASCANVTCGTHSISWRTCETAAVLLSTIHYARFSNWRPLHKDAFINLCRPFDAKLCSARIWFGPQAAHIGAVSRTSPGRSLSMWDALELTCCHTTLQVTDPRDRIQAILGLLTSKDRAAITIDPHTTCEDLYIQTTLHLLSQHGPRILVFSTPVYRTDQTLSLPSWAVDWSCTKDRVDLVHKLVAPFPDAYPYRTAPSHTLILPAALIGRILTVRSFSGELDDMYDIVNNIVESSLLHSLLRDLPDRRMQAWRALLSYVSNYHYGEIEWLDEYTKRRAEQTTATRISNLSKTDLIAAKSPTDIPQADAGSEPVDENYQCFIENFPIIYENTVFVAQRGLIGYAGAHLTLREGDAVYAFPGYDYPFVLRPEGEDDGQQIWSLVGKAKIEELIDVPWHSLGEVFNLDRFWAREPVMEDVRLR